MIYRLSFDLCFCALITGIAVIGTHLEGGAPTWFVALICVGFSAILLLKEHHNIQVTDIAERAIKLAKDRT